MSKRYIFIIAVFFIQVQLLFSQNPDTTRVIKAVQISPVTYTADSLEIDTSLFNTRFYNTPFQNTVSVTFTGNAGQAFINNQIFIQTDYQPFFFHRGLVPYFHTPYNTLHFNTRKPFTELKYLTSGGRADSEQVINALHTQNINQYTNIGLNYDVIASKGIYIRQEALANRFTLFGSYNKDNYTMYTSVNTNRIQNQENGGLRDIDNFIVHPANDPLAYPVKLNNASSRTKKNSFFITQSYMFKKSRGDSTRSAITLLPSGAGINHTFNYSRYIRTYRDQIQASDTIDFYRNNYYLINTAYDSAFMHTVDNAITVSFKDRYRKNLIMAGIKHQFQGFSYLFPALTSAMENDVENDTITGKTMKKNYNNVSVTGNMAFHIKKFSAFLNGEYFLSGYRANDIDANLIMNKTFGREASNIRLGAVIRLYEPDFFLKNYSSSHFLWNNDYSKTFDLRGFAYIGSGNGMIFAKGEGGLLRNFIYFNESAIPVIKENNLYLASFTLHKAFKWGGFNHVHDAILQYANDQQAVRFPFFAYKNSTYYENAFFNRVLKIQLGFDFLYNVAYYPDAYMPALGVFYRQQEMRTGDYPYINGFLNWKVKRTRFYLKYTNALAGIAGHEYFTAYGYPMNWGSFKFGLAWTFYD